ncbi:MAG: glycoside hydrolase family 43 protein, partial [Bacteroidales bacterium]|nr:glycoside hydrolase family 43 protein [Bacteroidales bacterium]
MKWIKGLMVVFLGAVSIAVGAQCSFTNPVMEGADPFVFHHEGYYYMLVTRGDRVGIKRSKDLHRIHEYNEIVAWRFQNTPVGGHIWAPEMYLIDGKWYIYTCGQNTGLSSNPVSVPYIQEDQQMVLLESQSDDPFGPYKFKTWLLEGTGAIDQTIFTHSNGERYIIWSQFNKPGHPQTQCLYIAELLNAWTIGPERIKISCPDQAWELNGWPVNEGAAVLQRNGKTYVVYSGSGYTTPEYALGYLVNTDGDLLNPASWQKAGPVFQQNPSGGIYSTGHNSFTQSPDGSEDWIVYHGRLSRDGNTSRYVFLQKFYWKGDEPFFGVPAPVNTPVVCPGTGRGQIVSISPYNNDSEVILSEATSGNLNLWLVDSDAYDIFSKNARYM